jgi:magnesium transporter
LVVCDGDVFRGIVTIEALLAAPAQAAIGEIMDPDPPLVGLDAHQQVAAWQATKRGEAALAVVDADRHFVGLIPPDRVLAILDAEHEEDLSRLGGFTQGLSRARRSGEERVLRRFRHRLPWVLVGVVGALLGVEIVARFERQLQANLALAFFIPAVVYLADAVGTQTETVVVRALSVGLRLREMVWRELLTGLAIGTLVAGLASPWVWVAWDDPRLAACIGLSLLLACTSATLIGVLLPWGLDRLEFDPAFGSGPLATVIQDMLSVLIYLSVASWLLGVG